MKTRKWALIFLTAILGLGTGAQAAEGENAFNIGLSNSWFKNKFDSVTASSYDNLAVYQDFNVGYQWTNFYLGLDYHMYNLDSTSGPTTTRVSQRTAFGATLGYHNTGFIADMCFYFIAKETHSNFVDFEGGSGYKIQLGYNHPITPAFYMGFSFLFRSINYSKLVYTALDTTVTETQKQVESYPTINLGFYF